MKKTLAIKISVIKFSIHVLLNLSLFHQKKIVFNINKSSFYIETDQNMQQNDQINFRNINIKNFPESHQSSFEKKYQCI